MRRSSSSSVRLSCAKCSESSSMARSRSRSSETTGLSGPDCAMIDRFPLAPNEQSVVEERGEHGADHGANPVRRLSLEDSACDGRSERPRRVERTAREWADGENARADRQADGKARDARRFRIDGRSKNHEDEEERDDGLESDRLSDADLGGNRLPAEPGGL